MPMPMNAPLVLPPALRGAFVASIQCSLGLATASAVLPGLVGTSMKTPGWPESIASENGHQILKNFLDIAAAWNARNRVERIVA